MKAHWIPGWVTVNSVSFGARCQSGSWSRHLALSSREIWNQRREEKTFGWIHPAGTAGRVQSLDSKRTCKAFWLSAGASLGRGFLQPPSPSARHVVLIFFCKVASRSWQCIPLPRGAHRTLCFMENDTERPRRMAGYSF